MIWSTMKDDYFDDSIAAALLFVVVVGGGVEKIVANNTDGDVWVEARRYRYFGSPWRFGRVVGPKDLSTGEQLSLLGLPSFLE
jgi:hypothetical protein